MCREIYLEAAPGGKRATGRSTKPNTVVYDADPDAPARVRSRVSSRSAQRRIPDQHSSRLLHLSLCVTPLILSYPICHVMSDPCSRAWRPMGCGTLGPLDGRGGWCIVVPFSRGCEWQITTGRIHPVANPRMLAHLVQTLCLRDGKESNPGAPSYCAFAPCKFSYKPQVHLQASGALDSLRSRR